jgi:hypothetical protein
MASHSPKVDGLDALCKLLVEALKSARVEPAEAETEREIALMESTTKLVLELCPEVPSGMERHSIEYELTARPASSWVTCGNGFKWIATVACEPAHR